MILLVHMIFGVAVGSLFRSPVLGVFVAFLSHYFLDLFPHIEYDIDDIKNKNWKKSGPAILKVFFDFITGLILIVGLSSGQLINFAYAFFAILPDGISFLQIKFLKSFDYFHLKRIHFLKENKNIPNFWRIVSQVLAVVIAIFILVK